MKRQTARKTLIYLAALSFPVTLYYMSPVLIIQGAAEGVIEGSFLLFSSMFAVSLVIGRLWCGWVCPGAGLQEACGKIRKGPARGGKLNWIKWFIWIPWILTIVLMFILAGKGISSIQPFYQTWYGISVYDIQGLVILVFIILLIVLPAILFGRRGFCHYLCWMAPFMIIGRWIRNRVRWTSLRLRSDTPKCRDCKACNKVCPMSLDVNGMVASGDMENIECILCGSCVDNCPNKVISYTFSRG